jgi:hypothetical protein
MKQTKGISFEAILAKITTTVDGGWNITLSVSQNEVSSIMELSDLRDMPLQIAIIERGGI